MRFILHSSFGSHIPPYSMKHCTNSNKDVLPKTLRWYHLHVLAILPHLLSYSVVKKKPWACSHFKFHWYDSSLLIIRRDSSFSLKFLNSFEPRSAPNCLRTSVSAFPYRRATSCLPIHCVVSADARVSLLISNRSPNFSEFILLFLKCFVVGL